MSQSPIDKFVSTPEGMLAYQREKAAIGVAELILGLMAEQGITKEELGRLTGLTTTYLSRLLNGGNVPLRTIASVMTALGQSLAITAVDLAPSAHEDALPEIEVCERTGDWWIDEEGKERPKYHAQIKGEPGYWGCGKSFYEAIGQVVSNHSERFAKITDLGRLPR